jgi:hypothetical protein
MIEISKSSLQRALKICKAVTALDKMKATDHVWLEDQKLLCVSDTSDTVVVNLFYKEVIKNEGFSLTPGKLEKLLSLYDNDYENIKISFDEERDTKRVKLDFETNNGTYKFSHMEKDCVLAPTVLSEYNVDYLVDLEIDAKKFFETLARCKRFIAKNDAREFLNHLTITIENNLVTFIGCDGHRIYTRYFKTESSASAKFSVNINTVNRLLKMKNVFKNTINVAISDKLIKFYNDDFNMLSQYVPANISNQINKIAHIDHLFAAWMDVELTDRALKLLKPNTKIDKENAINIHVNGAVNLSSLDEITRLRTKSVPLKTHDKAFYLTYNYNFVVDAFKSVDKLGLKDCYSFKMSATAFTLESADELLSVMCKKTF